MTQQQEEQHEEQEEQQETHDQTEWMHDFCENLWKIEREGFYPNDPEARKYLVDGTFASMVMNCLHYQDFDEDVNTENWDKEFICFRMETLLNDMENHPDDVLEMYGVEEAVRSQ